MASAVTVSLDAMAAGGMYDHVGGGFARYSVDREWLVPHFEKMLYDQALLVRVYSHAAVALGTDRWRQVAGRDVEYVLARPAPCRRRLLLRRGRRLARGRRPRPRGSVPHVDARRGARRARRLMRTRRSSGTASPTPANFEGARRSRTGSHHRGDWVPPPAVDALRQRLFDAREQRARPGLDDKVLTEWNALMIAVARRGRPLLGEPSWVDAAADATPSSCSTSCAATTGAGPASWHADGTPRARHAALAADHAALRRRVHPARRGDRGGPIWIDEAMDMADTLLDHFWDPGEGGLFTTADDAEALVVRQKDLFDNATPSANSTAAVAPVPPRRAHRRGSATPTTPTASWRSSARSSAAAPAPSATRSARSPCARAASPRSPSSATDPTSSPSPATTGGPTPCWPGASATTPRCGTAAPTASPTCATTTPARRPRTPPRG